MSDAEPSPVTGEEERSVDWRSVTEARIELGRSGNALPTAAVLAFQLDHARARDAVDSSLDVDRLVHDLGGESVVVQSAAADRAQYLQNPELGRRLAEGQALPHGPFDLVIVLADGLSASGVQTHGPTIAHSLTEAIHQLRPTWTIGPYVIAEQGRVAIGDGIGDQMQARLVVVLIGERPGLSAADSVGAYLTWEPEPGCLDSARNCVSNIRTPGGLDPAVGAANVAWLADRAATLQLTGVELKDRFAPLDHSLPNPNRKLLDGIDDEEDE